MFKKKRDKRRGSVGLSETWEIGRSGETGVSLSCQARGKPAPEVKWMFGDERISDDSEMFIINTTSVTNRNDKSVMVWSTLYFR